MMFKHGTFVLAILACGLWLFGDMGSNLGRNLLLFAGVMVVASIYLLFLEGEEE